MKDGSRTAIVTGASIGIGAALARHLAADGLRLTVDSASDAAGAALVVADIEAAGGAATAVGADVSEAAGVRSLFDADEAAYGPVDLPVDDAGILKASPLAEVNDEDYARLVAVNLTGTFFGLREGARRVRDGGRIISLSTGIVGTYLPAHGVYAATKVAVETMTRVLAKELGPRGVTANAVAPGPVATELFLTGRSEELIGRLAAEIPLGRLRQPDDVARRVVPRRPRRWPGQRSGHPGQRGQELAAGRPTGGPGHATARQDPRRRQQEHVADPRTRPRTALLGRPLLHQRPRGQPGRHPVPRVRLDHWRGLPVLAALFGCVALAARSAPSTTAWYWLAIVLVRAAATNLSDWQILKPGEPPAVRSPLSFRLVIATWGVALACLAARDRGRAWDGSRTETDVRF